MRKQIVTVALVGSLGLAGVALVGPSLASAQETPAPSASSNPVTSRLTALKDALKGLVSDKTLTQAQADRVAATLAEKLPARGGHGHGGRGGAHLDAATVATAAGATEAELRTAREAGQTLAQLAQSKGVSKATLVDRLVKAGEAALAEEVTEGDLTQAQADARKAGLEARVTEMVDRVGGPGHGGRGHHGPDERDGDDDAPSSTTPSSTTPSSTATA